MKSRAGYALVGLSTLAVVATLLGFALWFSSGGATNKLDVQVVFKDKVSGLTRGSSVLFNGLLVGEVIQMTIRPEDSRQITALIRVDQSTPLRDDTRARLEAQGLAGVVVVQLLGGEAGAAPLSATADHSIPTIYAEPSEDILETVRRVAKGVDDALNGMDAFVKTNAVTVSETIRSGEQFSVEMADNSSVVLKMMQSIAAVADFLGPLPQALNEFSKDLTETLRSVDRKKVSSVVDDVEQLTSQLASADKDVGQAAKNVSSMAQKLNRAADQVEGVLAGAQSFLTTATGQDGRNLFSDVSETAKSIRAGADNFNKQSIELTKEIRRITDAGSDAIRTFAADGGRVLRGAARALSDLEQDPQKLIFGKKEQLPQYYGPK